MEKTRTKEDGKKFLWDVKIVEHPGSVPLGSGSAGNLVPSFPENKTNKETECSVLTENFHLIQPVMFELQVYNGSCTEFFFQKST